MKVPENYHAYVYSQELLHEIWHHPLPLLGILVVVGVVAAAVCWGFMARRNRPAQGFPVHQA